MAKPGIRHGVVAVVVLAVAALVLPPFINIGRYKGRVAESLSRALGRPVTVDSVELRLLPQPGFYLQNLVVGDDPAYSAESLLRADEVTAYLRLSSLWRGRLEIARLNLKYPSLNLVERGEGEWNLESLLWRASRTEAAPTAAPVMAGRSRFPYIEASNGRINFKHGLEKSAFSLTEADFTLFSSAEGQWNMRLAARPVRTDMPVTDTGTIKAEATIERAPLLKDAPLKASVTWEHVQLGNLTRLIYGEDRGWRGQLDTSAQLSGTPAELHFATAARLREFRRYDVGADHTSALNATCNGVAELSLKELHLGDCRLPLGAGVLSVRGLTRGLRHPQWDLMIGADNVPAEELVSLARRTRPGLPDDLHAQGNLAASFRSTNLDGTAPKLMGNLQIGGLVLRSSVLGKELVLPRIVATANTEIPGTKRHAQKAKAPAKDEHGLVLESFELPLGAAAPVSVEGELEGAHYRLHMKGDTRLERLQELARATGIGAPRIAVSGAANVDLTLNGTWLEFSGPAVGGSAVLKNARAEVTGLSQPVEIATARAEFDGQRFTLRNAAANIGKVALTGSASFPRNCRDGLPCQATFELATEEFNLQRWDELLNPQQKKAGWFRLPGTDAGAPTVISNLDARGHLTARRVTLETTSGETTSGQTAPESAGVNAKGTGAASSGTASSGTTAQNVVTGSALDAQFTVLHGVVELHNVHAELMGGAVSGEVKMDFTGEKPKYEASGVATKIQAEKLASLVKGSLGSGVVSGKYKFTMSGLTAAELYAGAEAETEFSWTGGALKVSPDGRPLRVVTGAGEAELGKDGWTLRKSHWKTPAGVYELRGGISRDSVLTLVFTEERGKSWRLAGTLLKPETLTATAKADDMKGAATQTGH
jgi:hypothetical protein